jgi:hypothetical protein
MHKVFTSVEFWAALFGALGGAVAAFLLEAIRRWAFDRKHELAAGNEAVFTLAQMHTLATLLFNQIFKDREATLREIQSREPFYFEYLPMGVPSSAAIKVPLDRLGFILASYHPDLLNRLAAVDREFASVLETLAERNRQQRDFQRRHVELLKSTPAGVAPHILEQLIGADLCSQLKANTDFLKRNLPRCAEHALSAGSQLTEMLSYHFPVGRITNFAPIPRTTAVEAPAVTGPAWRRAVRALVTRIRRPTGVVIPPDSTLE